WNQQIDRDDTKSNYCSYEHLFQKVYHLTSHPPQRKIYFQSVLQRSSLSEWQLIRTEQILLAQLNYSFVSTPWQVSPVAFDYTHPVLAVLLNDFSHLITSTNTIQHTSHFDKYICQNYN